MVPGTPLDCQLEQVDSNSQIKLRLFHGLVFLDSLLIPYSAFKIVTHKNNTCCYNVYLHVVNKSQFIY